MVLSIWNPIRIYVVQRMCFSPVIFSLCGNGHLWRQECYCNHFCLGKPCHENWFVSFFCAWLKFFSQLLFLKVQNVLFTALKKSWRFKTEIWTKTLILWSYMLRISRTNSVTKTFIGNSLSILIVKWKKEHLRETLRKDIDLLQGSNPRSKVICTSELGAFTLTTCAT